MQPQKIAYKNRFRLLLGFKKIRLNTISDSKGIDRFVEGFDTLGEAIAAKKVFSEVSGIDIKRLIVQTYSQNTAFEIPPITELANEVFKVAKTFSGKGLARNNYERGDSKYKPGKWYGGEVRMAESVNHSKGRSTLPKEKKIKNQNLVDSGTFSQISKSRGGYLNLEYNLIDSLRKKGFKTRLDLKNHLKKAAFSVRQSNNIITIYYS